MAGPEAEPLTEFHTKTQRLWNSIFQELFGSSDSYEVDDFHDRWTLRLVTKPPVNYTEPRTEQKKKKKKKTPPDPNTWIRYRASRAKVHFECSVCDKTWSSMGGNALFYFRRNNPVGEQGDFIFGDIQVILSQQKCKRCQKDYELPIWYEDETWCVLEDLYHELGVRFYGVERENPSGARRGGKMRKPHASELCQACHQGYCTLKSDERKKGSKQ